MAKHPLSLIDKICFGIAFGCSFMMFLTTVYWVIKVLFMLPLGE